MKKLLILMTAVLMLLAATPAFALFTNGGFETGDFTGWTLDSGTRAADNTKNITWGQVDNGLHAVIDDTATMAGQTLDIDPYIGNYMARINDINGGYDATKLTQSDAITQADIDAGSTIYVDWGAALIEPSNEHPKGAQPYFGISVAVNGTVIEEFSADALDHDSSWANAGYKYGTLWYKNEVWSYDLSGLSLGDMVTIELFVSDCGWGGHGGYAFLDGVSTTRPTGVPEPATLFLLGSGLIGLAALRKKKFIKKQG